MTYGELARRHGLTLRQLQAEAYEYLQCEGYDDDGREYETLEA